MNASLLTTEQSAQGLYDFALFTNGAPGTTTDYPFDYPGYIPQYDHTEGGEVLYSLDGEGKAALLEGLESPDSAERQTALTTLLTIERTRQVSDALFYELAGTGRFIVDKGKSALNKIINGEDAEQSALALRFLCHRVGSSDSEAILSANMHKLLSFHTEDSDTAGGRLYKEFMDALGSKDKGQGFRRAFLTGLGYGLYDDSYPAGAWELNGTSKPEVNWPLRNMEVMAGLEQIEKGLSRKITDEFKIKNFGRFTPKMLAAMYKDLHEHPERSYVVDLVATSDYNLAFNNPDQLESLFFSLRKKGIGYEVLECQSAQDVKAVADRAVARKSVHGALVSDLIVRGHGATDSIRLSGREKLDASSIWSLRGLKDCLSETARVIVDSCSTGKDTEAGIARQIGQLLERISVAPNRDSGSAISVNRDGSIDIAYFHPSKLLRRALKAGHIVLYLTMVGGAQVVFNLGLKANQDKGEDASTFDGLLPFIVLLGMTSVAATYHALSPKMSRYVRTRGTKSVMHPGQAEDK